MISKSYDRNKLRSRSFTLYEVPAEEHEEDKQPRALRGYQNRDHGQRKRPRQEEEPKVIPLRRETPEEEAVPERYLLRPMTHEGRGGHFGGYLPTFFWKISDISQKFKFI